MDAEFRRGGGELGTAEILASNRGHLHSSVFADDPVGINVDPDYLLEQLRARVGTTTAQTRSRDPPGASPRANKRATTFERTL